LLAGSFHPAHAGHLELARVASRLLGGPVHFELSVVNVDKPPLSAADVRRRLLGLAWQGTVELTRAATFQEKARLFPGITFVVGLDTAERVVDPRYYAGSKRAMIEALDEISAQGCRFLVAGRADARGCWRTLAELDIPGVYAGLFAEIPAEHFRMDISSTELRERKS
jgi:nicotinic acid mononucleotide adenylyltransferase